MVNVDKTKQLAKNNKVLTVFDFFEQKKDLIQAALPKTITPERLIGVFTMILKSSPELSACSQTSLISAVIQAAQLGLQPGNIGHFYLVPFNNKKPDGKFQREVQFIIGYKGLCELVNRSGRAVVLTAEVVKEQDIFEHELGLNPKLRHVPAEGDRGETIGAYAIAKNLDANEKVFVYLDKFELEKIRGASKAKDSKYSPWVTWPDAMKIKSAVKRLCKLLPLSSDAQRQISADETVKNDIRADMTEVKDETNWQETEDAQISEESPPPETPPPAKTEEEVKALWEGEDLSNKSAKPDIKQ